MKIINKSGLFVLLFSVVAMGLAMEEKDEPIRVKWEMLSKVEWVWEDDFYQARFSDEVKKLDGKEVIIEGFMFPLEYTRRHTTFLVSGSPMTDCFFCGPGEAEAMVYVKSLDEIEYKYTPIRMKGIFKLVSDASMGIIYEMDDARLVN